MEEQESVVFYQRMAVPPGQDLVDHASKLGIKLKSKPLMPRSKMQTRPFSNRAKTAPSNINSLYKRLTQVGHGNGRTNAATMYIQDVVVPLHNPSLTEDSMSKHWNATKLPSGSRSKSALPYVNVNAPGYVRAGARSTLPCRPSSRDVIQTSTPAERNMLGCSSHMEESHNHSDQALRYESEQSMVAESRMRKRTSQIQSHRVERMYYMSGNNVNLRQRYQVSDDDVNKLQLMSSARQQNKHYGRGLSDESGKSKSDNRVKQVPRQPPPSSIGDSEQRATTIAPLPVISDQDPTKEGHESDDDSVSLGANTDRQDPEDGENKADDVAEARDGSSAFITQQDMTTSPAADPVPSEKSQKQGDGSLQALGSPDNFSELNSVSLPELAGQKDEDEDVASEKPQSVGGESGGG